ncbi:MAG: Carboxylesterase NlhH [candidate division BRC1 bacterium ADurb.BinA364]|nr:MAG: Carboxylesterase NlhH [candidate division BRC1 bacterium ADurb.BinA364]
MSTDEKNAAAPSPDPFANQNPPFSLPENVELREGVVYGRGGGRDLLCNLFLPRPPRKKPMAAMVYIHGGGWRNGGPAAFRRQAAYFAGKHGVIGMCVTYRLSDEAIYPAAVEDCKCAVRFLRAHAAELGVDPRRIGAAGGSAGGHLAGMLAAASHLAHLEGQGGWAGESSAIQAACLFNPALDMRDFPHFQDNPQNSVFVFLGGSPADLPAVFDEASPLTHVGPQTPPCLVLHGTADPTVPFTHARKFVDKMKAHGRKCELFAAEGAQHGFFNRPPWYEPTLRAMEAFLAEHLPLAG